MDIQGVLRWLVDAKIPVSKAMPLVSALAAKGVKSSEDIAQLDEDALLSAINDTAFV